MRLFSSSVNSDNKTSAKPVRRVSVILILLGLLFIGTATGVAAQALIKLIGKQADGSIIVPSNQILRPAGNTTVIGERPVDMAMRPDGKQIAVTTMRLTYLLDTATGKVTHSFDRASRNFAGLSYSPDGKFVYYAKSYDHNVTIAAIGDDGKANVVGSVDTGDDSFPAGLSVSPDGKSVYVALFGTSSMGIIDIGSKKMTKAMPVGGSPFGAYVSPDGTKVYSSNWSGSRPITSSALDPHYPSNKVNPVTGATFQGTLSVYDVAKDQMLPEIEVGLHPTAITFDKNSTRLYVANANDDTISVIDLTPTHAANPELERILVRPGTGMPFGSMPNGLTLNAKGDTLYVANGGNNAIAVVALGDLARAPADPKVAPTGTTRSTLTGFIPTEWYPIGVALSPDNSQIYVANNKGEGSLNNLPGYDARSVYNVTGSVSLIPMPTKDQLASFTSQVDANSSYTAKQAEALLPARTGIPVVAVPERVGEQSVFKHVIYVIKENRTYDQVLGDLGQGNGDAKLTQFPRKVSPNHHALAERFGTLDNFYTSTINSADGHQWTNEAVANVFTERVFGIYPTGTYGDGSLNLPTDTLYSNVVAHGLTLRNYGEQADTTVSEKQADGSYKKLDSYKWADVYANWKARGDKYKFAGNTIVPPLQRNQHPGFPGFDMNIPDQIRADIWQAEFGDYVKNSNLPQLSVIWLTNDHTSGTSPGYPNPSAMVADNDLALGRIVDSVSHSAYWKDTVIFVVEDDAQDGTDHVDGHRTIAYAISAYSKKGVNSVMYTQPSMVRTMEQILGLPPINQFDLTATLMTDAFTSTPDLTPYTVVPNEIPLDQMNQAADSLSGQSKTDALVSLKMDFSKPDLPNEADLNRIIWRATMGEIPYPTFEWEKRQTITKPDEDDEDKVVPGVTEGTSDLEKDDDNAKN